MKIRFALAFLILLAFDTAGQVGFKLTADSVGASSFDLVWTSALLHTPSVVIIAVAYLGAFVTYMGLIRTADVGPLFAATHLDLVTVTAISVVWFGERLGTFQAAGCLLILAGVVLLGLASPDPRGGSARDGAGSQAPP